MSIQARLKIWWHEFRHGPSYVMFVHPDRLHDLLTLKAKDEWKSKYSYYRRIKRFGGKLEGWDGTPATEFSPRQIMALKLPKVETEIGYCQGVRFIQSGAA